MDPVESLDLVKTAMKRVVYNANVQGGLLSHSYTSTDPYNCDWACTGSYCGTDGLGDLEANHTRCSAVVELGHQWEFQLALVALGHKGVETYVLVRVDEEVERRLCADPGAWSDREGRAAGLQKGIHGCLGVNASTGDHIFIFEVAGDCRGCLRSWRW
jgi:hypothetical protein